ncbi:hypothetical protein Pla100_31560 [Neorhodopirellula pilleata]|uniref:DUF1559 domain-containing protein n=1 Tax=Neorhodopirellula pilleata TaxID=2714738 RepID=A0A5C6A871_9BACT|nr:hypothetical protein Pla100_31560 [Neorhodopirellula pilleata]
MTNIPTLRCPSDPGSGLPGHGRTNYGACLGDTSFGSDSGHQPGNGNQQSSGQAQNQRASCRGVFVPCKDSKFRDILDGLANTIAAGELATDLGDRDKRTHFARINIHASPIPGGTNAWAAGGATFCEQWVDAQRPQFWQVGGGIQLHGGAEDRRGMKWAFGRPNYSGVLTILPPNRELCGRSHVHLESIAPPSSRHQGGCHVLMADGAVKFVTDSIEAGNSDSPMVTRHGATLEPGVISPFGLWGALGTRASKETIEEEL